jgi:hypothetical protein
MRTNHQLCKEEMFIMSHRPKIILWNRGKLVELPEIEIISGKP